MSKKSKFVDVENTRTPEQRAVYEKIADAEVDPFETERFKKHHKHPIIFENETWLLTHNSFPYEGTSLHLLIVHKVFITSIEQITREGWVDFYDLIQFVKKEFNLTSGGFFMRFGDTKKTGGTVTHLHAHITVADGEPEERRSMYVKVT